mmetsp:Transcript_12876/g.22460  ORF Transcript_12876/g.22460 Transcript_12876/m.22460 type:complete len:584 (-) Transcript_12876:1460-3211(-)
MLLHKRKIKHQVAGTKAFNMFGRFKKNKDNDNKPTVVWCWQETDVRLKLHEDDMIFDPAECYIKYDDKTTAALEKSFAKKGTAEKGTMSILNKKYTVDFDAMIQTNNLTQWQRPIKRVVVNPPAEDSTEVTDMDLSVDPTLNSSVISSQTTPSGSTDASNAATMDDLEPFFQKLIEADDRNVVFKVAELSSLVENVHHMKLFYTFVGQLCRTISSGDVEARETLTDKDRKRYVLEALQRTAKTTSGDDCCAIFKTILEKCHEDGLLDTHNKHLLDREAEVVHTSSSSFVSDIRRHLAEHDVRLQALEARMDNVETKQASLTNAFRQLHSNMRMQRRIETAVGVVCAVTNALSMGVAGSLMQGIVNTTISQIVDFGNIEHILSVVDAIGNSTTSAAIQDGLAFASELSLTDVVQTAGGAYSSMKQGEMSLGIEQMLERVTSSYGDEGVLVVIALAATIAQNASQSQSRGQKTIEDKAHGNEEEAAAEAATGLTTIERVVRLEENIGVKSEPAPLLERVELLEITLGIRKCSPASLPKKPKTSSQSGGKTHHRSKSEGHKRARSPTRLTLISRIEDLEIETGLMV